MAHIQLPEGMPGIRGPLAYRPETAKPLLELAEVLLRGDNSLSRGERELIAAYVSHLNHCLFCHTSHASLAALQLEDGWDVIDAVIENPETAPITDKMKALLAVAAKVQSGGLAVQSDDIEAAKALGATDAEVHDTVLIAAAFCMYNRYVDGLATWAPPNREDYTNSARMIIERGYTGPRP